MRCSKGAAVCGIHVRKSAIMLRAGVLPQFPLIGTAESLASERDPGEARRGPGQGLQRPQQARVPAPARKATPARFFKKPDHGRPGACRLELHGLQERVRGGLRELRQQRRE